MSLDEAYRYAYDHTLASTSATSIGGQHATYEANLRGKGDVPLTYLVAPTARLALPAALSGKVVVQDTHNGAVVADLTKAAAETTVLALSPGRYRTVVEYAGNKRRCDVSLLEQTETELQVEGCPAVQTSAGAAKGGTPEAPSRWGAEAWLALPNRPYGNNLGQEVVATYRLQPNFSALGSLGHGMDYHATVWARVHAGWPRDLLTLYAQAGGGISYATTFVRGAYGTFWGPRVAFAAGVQVMPLEHFGLLAQAGVDAMPAGSSLQFIVGARAQL